MTVSRKRRSDLTGLQKKIGHHFHDPSLLERALTHRSALHENPDLRSNETLEFLGDAVVGLLVAETLMALSPEVEEGTLSRARSAAVSTTALATWGRELGLGPLLNLGGAETGSGGREKDSILAGACEALLAALYLDGGLETVRTLVQKDLGPGLRRLLARQSEGGLDPKTRLQEILQADGKTLPEYQVVETRGPAHRPLYRVQVQHGGVVLGQGEGSSKKTAEQEAARLALQRLDPE